MSASVKHYDINTKKKIKKKNSRRTQRLIVKRDNNFCSFVLENVPGNRAFGSIIITM